MGGKEMDQGGSDGRNTQGAVKGRKEEGWVTFFFTILYV
jgi:hypothetical protein